MKTVIIRCDTKRIRTIGYNPIQNDTKPYATLRYDNIRSTTMGHNMIQYDPIRYASIRMNEATGSNGKQRKALNKVGQTPLPQKDR